MASTTAMFSGLSGLNTNARQLEVIGNNISNVNTNAFKSSRLLFSSQLQRNISLGSGPSGANGGTNPSQIGLGVGIGATQRNFVSGGTSTTGIASDLAIEGDGFFILNSSGDQFYTRDGAFQFNATNDLITTSGARVQGYAVDENFQIIEGQLTDLNIPLGVATIAEATQNVEFSGNLNADGAIPTTGAVFDFGALQDNTATDITLATLLVDLNGAPLTAGDEITISGAERGGKTVPDATFTVSATNTVQDFLDFMQRTLGVVPAGGYNVADPNQPGPESGDYSIAAGVITFRGNIGELNDLVLGSENIVVNGGAGTNPFGPAKVASANGESVRTTYVIYDSLGTPINVDLTMALSRTDDGGTYWRTFLHSADDTDQRLHLESGSDEFTPYLQFDNNGRLVDTTPISVELDRTLTGATDPLFFDLRFDTEGSNVTALASPEGEAGVSTIASTFQDGSPLGVLSSFSVGVDGVITGGFSNGLSRTIGQVAVAKFTNPEGLIDAGGNQFSVGPNSGTPLVTSPLEFGTGRILGGALELSNVDLSQEFINMILTSTGYSAASRVITTSDELIQQLLLIGR
ncbi:MAG: flagellar hook-basal body complex protein [Planctomycetota bacterium]